MPFIFYISEIKNWGKILIQTIPYIIQGSHLNVSSYKYTRLCNGAAAIKLGSFFGRGGVWVTRWHSKGIIHKLCSARWGRQGQYYPNITKLHLSIQKWSHCAVFKVLDSQARVISRADMGNFEMCGINDLFKYDNIGSLQWNFTHKIVI